LAPVVGNRLEVNAAVDPDALDVVDAVDAVTVTVVWCGVDAACLSWSL
jgi:hypothetical protein